MKIQSLKIPAIIMAIGLILSILACMLVGILQAPTVTEHDFSFSATYRLAEETKTVAGTYRVHFLSTGEGMDPKDRYYEGQYIDNPSETMGAAYPIAQQDDLTLCVVFILTPDYLMGDGEWGEAYSDAVPEPYLAVFDKEGYEYSDAETLAPFQVELLSWQTPQPIDNPLVFAGFSRLHDGSMMAMLAIALLVLIACLIFVKRDRNFAYNALDIISIVLNCLIGVLAIPFMTLVIWLMALTVSGEEFMYQLLLCVPALTLFTIAASLCLRRKGFRFAGFFLPFAGPVLFALSLLLESVLLYFAP